MSFRHLVVPILVPGPQSGGPNVGILGILFVKGTQTQKGRRCTLSDVLQIHPLLRTFWTVGRRTQSAGVWKVGPSTR